MKNNQPDKLHIVGKVPAAVVKNLNNAKKPASKTVWLFVGYCFYPFPVDSLFDIVLEEATQRWNHDYTCRLAEIYDEFGASHEAIPQGYKTICSFECTPAIPPQLKKLPVLTTWQFDDPSVYLCNHESIKLFTTPLENHWLFGAVTQLLFEDLHRRKKKHFSVKEVAEILPKESSHFIIENLLLTGRLKKGKKEDELILAD